MKINKGTTRVAVQIGPIVLKFCRIQPLFVMFSNILEVAIKRRRSQIPLIVRGSDWHYFTKGIKANIAEYRCWRKTRASFLAPTYLGLGFVNVQKRATGRCLTEDEVNELIHDIGRRLPKIFSVNPHCLEPDDFIRNESGYVIVDYGDASDDTLRFGDFIVQHKDELAEILRQP